MTFAIRRRTPPTRWDQPLVLNQPGSNERWKMRSKTSCTLGFITSENGRFFVQKEKKSAEAVCESCLQCSSVPLNLWAFPWSPTTLSSLLIETDPRGSRRWFLQRWFFDHIVFLLRQVRVNGLVEFCPNCMDLSKVQKDGNTIGTLPPLLTSICYCHWDDGIPKQRRRRPGDIYVIFPSWKVHSLPNKLRKVYSFFNKLTPDRLN